MKIVKLKKEHAPTLHELERQCFSEPWSERSLREAACAPNTCFLVAEEKGLPLGYGGMHCVQGQCYIDNIAVFEEHRGRGIGRAITEALCENARSHEGEFISLEVRPSNTVAVSLYLSLGFVQAGIRKGFYRDPPEDGLILTKYFHSGGE